MYFKSAVRTLPMLFSALFLLSGAVFLFAGNGSAYGYGRGKYLFNYYNCIDCHAVNGIGGTLGPSLSGYGSKNKGYAWTVTQIKNPKAHYQAGAAVKINGKSYLAVMPSYGYIPAGDLKGLAEYLCSLKK